MSLAAGVAGPVRTRRHLAVGLVLAASEALAACAGGPSRREPAAVAPPVREAPYAHRTPPTPEAVPDAGVRIVPLANLKGWSADDHRAALAAFRQGCVVSRNPSIRPICRAAGALGDADETTARTFFERRFRAEILPGEGVLTGYFAPVYPASRRRAGPYTAPVRPLPPAGQLIDARMTFAQSGPAAGGSSSPLAAPPAPQPADGSGAAPAAASSYATTAGAGPGAAAPSVAASLDLSALERPSNDPVADLLDGPAARPSGSAAGTDPRPPATVAAEAPSPPTAIPPVRVRLREADRAVIDQAPADGVAAWMRPEDLFFMQIQGSGILVFPDGDRIRAAYAGDNGRPFVGIARPMIRDGLLPASGASGDGIRRWLAAHAGDTAAAVMQKNPRYVFFRLVADTGAEPQGAAGVPLPAGRAIAMDSSHHDFGSLYWIDAEAPTLTGATAQYHRLAVALDTGGAIRGPIRADLYFGTGEEAGREAGRVKHVLHLARLVPAEGDLSEESDAATSSPRGR